MDFSQIKYNGYDGYYTKAIEIEGVSKESQKFFIVISETEIRLGYIRELKQFISVEKMDDGRTARNFEESAEGDTWIFSIDERNNIELDHIEAIG